MYGDLNVGFGIFIDNKEEVLLRFLLGKKSFYVYLFFSSRITWSSFFFSFFFLLFKFGKGWECYFGDLCTCFY